MAVPKKKRSLSKSRIKRAHWKLEVPTLRACSNCGFLSAPHRACPSCGFYKGKQVMQIKVKEPKQKD